MPTRHATDVIGLVIALPTEARSLGVRRARPGSCLRFAHGWLAIAGAGRPNAMHAAEQLLTLGVNRLANWGVAGALEDDLVPGDVVVPDRVLHTHEDAGFVTDPDGRANLLHQLAQVRRVRQGALWSAECPLATCAAKRELAAASGAVAVDMEAAGVAAVAASAGVPFVAVKAICDSVVRELPACIVDTFGNANSGVSWRMLVTIALGGPATWRATASLAHDFACARRSLAYIATCCA